MAVTDSGPGIAPAELPLLFQPFSQTTTGKRTSQGTGLGLLGCRHLVEAHGGRIWAESQPGRGARFAFRLPRRGVDARAGDEVGLGEGRAPGADAPGDRQRA